MNIPLDGLVNGFAGQFWLAVAVFLRVSAAVWLLPAIGETSVPQRVKLGAAVAFTMIVAPAIPWTEEQIGVSRFFALAAAELIAGGVLGLLLRLFVLALQTAGSIAAQATSLSQILGLAAIEPIPAMGHVLVLAGLTFAVLTGLHVRIAEFLIWSYDVFPPGRFPDAAELARWSVGQVARLFALAFSLAAPFAITSLIYNLALGAINRAMPQLMVAFVGAPAITLGGLALLFVATPLIASVWTAALNGFLANPAGSAQ